MLQWIHKLLGLIRRQSPSKTGPAAFSVAPGMEWTTADAAKVKALLSSGFGARLITQLRYLEYRVMVNASYNLNGLNAEQNAFLARGIREAADFLPKLSYASDAQEAPDIGAQGEALTDETPEQYEHRHSP